MGPLEEEEGPAEARLLLYDLDEHVSMMDVAGIDAAWLTSAAGMCADLDTSRFVNDCAKKAERDYPGRFIGAAHAHPLDGAAAFKELNRCRHELGFQGVTITSRSGNGRPVRLNPANPRKGGEGSTPSDASPGDHAMLRDYFDNRGRYSNPTPAEIAMQSSLVPSQSSWASLPGFPTIPASGASGPVDVSLRNNGAPSGSSFGGPASLANTGFMLGPSTLPSPSSALDPNNTTVFVGGLSSLISEDTLKTFFAPFGAIAYVKIPPGKGCGFVSFLRKIDAERAIERMQGFPVGGCRIRLSWGRSQCTYHIARKT